MRRLSSLCILVWIYRKTPIYKVPTFMFTIPMTSRLFIPTIKEGTVTPTQVVELKFFSLKFPESISIYNIIFKVSPSVRSPLQCNSCLHFGHTAKFYSSNSRFSHYGENNHFYAVCPLIDFIEPYWIFSKLPHLITDCKCFKPLISLGASFT